MARILGENRVDFEDILESVTYDVATEIIMETTDDKRKYATKEEVTEATRIKFDALHKLMFDNYEGNYRIELTSMGENDYAVQLLKIEKGTTKMLNKVPCNSILHIAQSYICNGETLKLRGEEQLRNLTAEEIEEHKKAYDNIIIQEDRTITCYMREHIATMYSFNDIIQTVANRGYKVVVHVKP